MGATLALDAPNGIPLDTKLEEASPLDGVVDSAGEALDTLGRLLWTPLGSTALELGAIEMPLLCAGTLRDDAATELDEYTPEVSALCSTELDGTKAELVGKGIGVLTGKLIEAVDDSWTASELIGAKLPAEECGS